MPGVPAGDQSIIVAAGGNTSPFGVTLRVGFPFATPAAFSQMRITATYGAIFGFPITVTIEDPTINPPDPTKTVNKQTSAVFDRNIPCTIDLAGLTGQPYSAVLECKGAILANGLPDPSNLAEIKIWLQDGSFINNEIIFPTLVTATGADSFFFLNATGPIPVLGANQVPTTLFVSEEAPVSSAVMSIDFNGLAAGSPVVGTLHVNVADPTKTLIAGPFTGSITSVQ
jgi:hypothetical protein